MTEQATLFDEPESERQEDTTPVVVLVGTVVQPLSEHPTSQVERAQNYERTFIEPVQRLNDTLNDVLDVDASPDRSPEEALSIVREAMENFHEESATWL